MLKGKGYGLGELYVTALAQAGRDHLTVQNAKPLLDLPRIGIAVVAQDSCIAN